MADTTNITITRNWIKISDVQCLAQSISDRGTYAKTYFDMAIGTVEPASDTEAFYRIQLGEDALFNLAPVWLRLNSANADQDQPIVVTK